jgi:hypothetical protein
MKNLILVISLFIASFKLNAQDVITLKNGTELNGGVTEVTNDQVKFKKTKDGPIYSIQKSDVTMITYQNGKVEVITEENSQTNNSSTQEPNKDEEVLDAAKHYRGPRVGFTVLGSGTSNDRLNQTWGRKVNPVISQFGWQFESRIFTLKDGSTGLVEFVPMIGGFEQGLFLPSATGLIGFRGKGGFELGMGPTLSLSGTGIVFAAGGSYKVGKVTFPINVVFSPSIAHTTLPTTQYTYDPTTGQQTTQNIPSITSHSGFRVSLVVGFNSRKN